MSKDKLHVKYIFIKEREQKKKKELSFFTVEYALGNSRWLLMCRN
jgi:hypothetical protein